MSETTDRDGALDHYHAGYPPSRSRIPVELPPGHVLVHNHVRPAQRQGTRGFRFWLQAPDAHLERCACGWAQHLAAHYRVRRVVRPRTQPGEHRVRDDAKGTTA